MALKPKQKKLAELMACQPDMTNEQYADEVGINPCTVYAWKKTKDFQDYLHECCKDEFKGLEQLAIRKLKENCKKGNQKSIEYILDYLGYKATEKIEADLNTDITINIEGDLDDAE